MFLLIKVKVFICCSFSLLMEKILFIQEGINMSLICMALFSGTGE